MPTPDLSPEALERLVLAGKIHSALAEAGILPELLMNDPDCPVCKSIERALAAQGRQQKDPEWLMPALVDHVRKLGCKCPKPLIGYSPGFGPRCRLCDSRGSHDHPTR